MRLPESQEREYIGEECQQMFNMEPVKGGNLANVDTYSEAKSLMEDFQPLTEDEKPMLQKAAKIIESKRPVGCTGCHYCTDKGCPAGIRIPEVLNCLNLLHQYHNPRMARMAYYPAIREHGPRECLNCGSCENECPQRLSIRKLLREADKKLYVGENYDIWANH